MRTSYQDAKTAELKRLGWTEDGRQNLPGPGRSPMRYILVFTNSIGMRAYVYPAHIDYIADQAKPEGKLALSFATME